MKEFQFDTPLKYTDGTTIAAADLAKLQYILFVDTVNPPVQKFAVPQANIDAGALNADGSKHVTVLFSDIGFVPAPNVTYFAGIEDELGTAMSAESNILSFTNTETPDTPANFSVA